MAPVVEDMLWHGRTGLTKAVVMGLGRVVLCYGRWSLGEGLSLGEVRDAAFMLTGTGTWVGKLAHLSANPLTIQEGQQVITQAISKCQIGMRGPGHPCSYPTAPQPFRFYHGNEFPLGGMHWRCWLWPLTPTLQAIMKWGLWMVAKEPEASGTPPPHLPQIMDLKAIDVLCWQPHQYHHNLTGQKAPDIPIMVDIIGNLEATSKSICPSLKMRTQRTPSLNKVGDGIWLYTTMQSVEIIPSFPTPSNPCKGILESSWGAPGCT